MKFLYLSALTLAAAGALAQSGCITEMEKASSCISTIDAGKLEEIKDMDSVNTFCKNFEGDQCKDFIANAGKKIDNCDASTEDNKTIALMLYSLKVSYLTYCVKDSSGNSCPLTNLILDAAKNGGQAVGYDDEAKKVLIEDCKKDECNARLTSLIEISDELNKATGGTNPSEFTPVLDAYKNKKCDDINSITADAAANTNNNNGNNASGATTGTTSTTNSDKKEDNSGAETIKIFSALSLVSLLAAFFAF